MTQAYELLVTALLGASYWVYFLFLEYAVPGFSLLWTPSYVGYFLIIVLAFHTSMLRSKNQDVFALSSGLIESHRFTWPHMVFTTAVTCVFMAASRDASFSRFFLFTFLPGAYFVLLLFNRYCSQAVLVPLAKHRPQTMLLIGDAWQIPKVEPLLEKARIFNIAVIGILTNSPESGLPAGIRKLGTPDDLEKLLVREQFGSIFILGSPADRRILGIWMKLAEANGCRLTLVNDLDSFLQRRVTYFQCDGIDLIELRDEPLLNTVNRFLKRSFDIVVSLPVVLIVLPPLMVAVWILQRLQAPGPLFFKQRRSGLDNQPFGILKFRTMYTDRCDSSEQATKNDNRIYPAGRVLRKFSLDEFPQFLNVLLGHMSIAGPRPHMPEHDEIFGQVMGSYAIRGFVKPGLTGLAQIRGFRGEAVTTEDIVRRVECDIEYIESWSLELDLRIMWQTVIHVIRPPKTAY